MFEQASTITDLYKHYPQPITVSAGEPYSLHITTVDEIIGVGFTDKLNSRVWVDWNSDGDFTDAGEEVSRWDDHDPGLVTNTIASPAGASGSVRMRVYVDMPEEDGHDAPTPCGYLHSDNTLGQHGEVEDFTLAISTTTDVRTSVQQDVVCRPNPFTETVFIPLSLQAGGAAAVVIYNALGEEVARPFDGTLPPGAHTVQWTPGSEPAGLYYYRIQTGEYSAGGSVVLHR
jgi:hypothetical protein